MDRAPSAGRVVAGRYRLAETIGRGAMGTVWRAWDTVLDREIAVKELRVQAGLSADERARTHARAFREARTAARLSHPSLVTIYDVVEEDDRPWIVMELVAGRPLDQSVARNGPLPARRAAVAARHLLAGLATAHAAGVLHRDVKPSNVLLAGDDRTVLTDFGIAMFQGDTGLTQTGMVMGSAGFTAPERIRGEPATPASDLWSLGATLYAAVEGRGPFDHRGGAITTMHAVIDSDPPAAPAAGALGPVISALLRRNPAERPDAVAAARMVAVALAAVTAGQPGRAAVTVRRPAGPVGPTSAAGVRPAARPRSNVVPPLPARPDPGNATARLPAGITPHQPDGPPGPPTRQDQVDADPATRALPVGGARWASAPCGGGDEQPFASPRRRVARREGVVLGLAALVIAVAAGIAGAVATHHDHDTRPDRASPSLHGARHGSALAFTSGTGAKAVPRPGTTGTVAARPV